MHRLPRAPGHDVGRYDRFSRDYDALSLSVRKRHRPFPRYREIEPNVAFWIDIYSKIYHPSGRDP